MAEVIGLGGVFYKVADTERTKRWYAETLGLGGEWGIMLPYSRSPDGFGLLSAFKADSDYFGPSDKPFMINLRVDDLDGLISSLEAKGVEILGRQDDDYGRFAWILDCDGIKLELYQQAEAAE
jgi:predicted enzyme related to lactoylglutathione lyase